MPGATFEARWASTASPIEEVIANRSPNVATAHSMITSAGASSSSAPTWETSSRSSSGVRPSVWVPLKSRAARVERLMRASLAAGSVPGWRIIPVICTVKLRRHERHSQAPAPSRGNRFSSPQ